MGNWFSAKYFAMQVFDVPANLLRIGDSARNTSLSSLLLHSVRTEEIDEEDFVFTITPVAEDLPEEESTTST